MTDHKPLVSLFGELKQVPVTVSSRVTVGDRSAWVRVQDPLPGWQKPWQCGLSRLVATASDGERGTGRTRLVDRRTGFFAYERSSDQSLH